MPIRQGRYTLMLPSAPGISGYAAVAGKKEEEGPLGNVFDYIFEDGTAGEKSWEKAESVIHRDAVTRAIAKAGISPEDADVIFAGDFLNQCTGTTFGIREMGIPYAGVYGACSTMALSMAMAAVWVDSKVCNVAVASTSSHFCSAEQQYRTPLEYGGQRSPTAQWTVTGSGAFIVGTDEEIGVKITEAMPGIVVEKGINDAANMGAAMAPAALDTLSRYFKQSNTTPNDYDAIYTGDLGLEGSKILKELMFLEGYDLSGVYNDCGNIIFDIENQDVHSGGSGCGCSAVVLASYILPKLKSGEFKKVLLIGTGAMMSPSSLKQGLCIPAVAHLIKLESEVE